MSGGSWKYVIGNYAPNGNKYSRRNTTYNSGYTGLLADGNTYTGKNWLEDKYYDFYTSSDSLTACNGKSCISHALNEVAGWYGDNTAMVTAPLAWIMRGGHYGANPIMGIFYVNTSHGIATPTGTIRLVLSVS